MLFVGCRTISDGPSESGRFGRFNITAGDGGLYVRHCCHHWNVSIEGEAAFKKKEHYIDNNNLFAQGLLGLTGGSADGFIGTIQSVIMNMSRARTGDMALGFGSIAFLLIMKVKDFF